MVRRLIACAVMALWLVAAVSVAQADTGDIIEPQNKPATAADGWQAGTCTKDEITEQCTPESPVSQFFRTAAGHPQIGFTQYIVKQEEFAPGLFRPIGPVKTIRVDLPPGLTVNPQATLTRCTQEEFDTPVGPTELPGCAASSQVGEERLTLKVEANGAEVPPTPGVTRVPLYNMVPEFGEPAKFGFKIGAPGAKKIVYLNTEVAWESDYHESFTIHLPTPNPGTRSWNLLQLTTAPIRGHLHDVSAGGVGGFAGRRLPGERDRLWLGPLPAGRTNPDRLRERAIRSRDRRYRRNGQSRLAGHADDRDNAAVHCRR